MVDLSVARRLSSSAGFALELEGVGRQFGALVALADVILRVGAGERRAILGSNGAGKTTLFNAVTGDFPPTSGRIRFFGEDVTDFPVHERIRRGLRSDHVAIMVNGRVNRVMESRALEADRDLQQRLLGVGRHGHDETDGALTPAAAATPAPGSTQVFQVSRGGASADEHGAAPVWRAEHLPNRWGLRPMPAPPSRGASNEPQPEARPLLPLPFVERIGRTALVVGTFDTKGHELRFIRDCLRECGIHAPRSISRLRVSRRAPMSRRPMSQPCIPAARLRSSPATAAFW